MILAFLFLFQVFLAIQFGGIFNHFRYAYKVSNSLSSFLKNYLLSYTCSYRQVHNDEIFYPELNNSIEKLLSLGIERIANFKSFDSYRRNRYNYNDEILIIHKPKNYFDNLRNDYIVFNITRGTIENENVLLTPTIFILADKLYKINLQIEKDKAEQEKLNKF